MYDFWNFAWFSQAEDELNQAWGGKRNSKHNGESKNIKHLQKQFLILKWYVCGKTVCKDYFKSLHAQNNKDLTKPKLIGEVFQIPANNLATKISHNSPILVFPQNYELMNMLQLQNLNLLYYFKKCMSPKNKKIFLVVPRLIP